MAHFDPLLVRNKDFATTNAREGFRHGGVRMSTPGPLPFAREDS